MNCIRIPIKILEASSDSGKTFILNQPPPLIDMSFNILGVSCFHQKGKNTESLLQAALEAAQEAGAEVAFALKATTQAE